MRGGVLSLIRRHRRGVSEPSLSWRGEDRDRGQSGARVTARVGGQKSGWSVLGLCPQGPDDQVRLHPACV